MIKLKKKAQKKKKQKAIVIGIIANTINNVFNVVFIALGDSVAIIVGQLLGAGTTGCGVPNFLCVY